MIVCVIWIVYNCLCAWIVCVYGWFLIVYVIWIVYDCLCNMDCL